MTIRIKHYCRRKVMLDDATEIVSGHVIHGMTGPTGGASTWPMVELRTQLPEGREDLALFLKQRLAETTRQFVKEYLSEETL